MWFGGHKKIHNRAGYKAGFIFLIVLIMMITAAVSMANAASGTAVPIQQPVRVSLNPGLILANSLVVTITPSSNSINVNTPTNINASVTYYNGTPAIGATITLTCSPAGGTFGATSYTTNIFTNPVTFKTFTNYYLLTPFQSSNPGTYTITATATKTDFSTGTKTTTVTVVSPAAPSTPTPTPTPEPPTPIPPTVSQPAVASTQATSVTPTVAAISLTPTPTEAATNTTAAVSGDNGMGGLTKYLPYIVGAIILILLLLIIFLYLWTKKTLKIIPKETMAPCDGKTEIPVKVMFVNGFGGSKKPSSDVEVEMKTTAGTIKNVVLSSSRDFAEATLIAPREFGQATVSATANNKTANAMVNFTYKHATFDVSVTPDNIPSDGRSSANVKLQIKDENGSVIAPIVERMTELKTTLGTITSPVRIPSKATEANATITAGEVSGTAVIYVVSGDIKGEGKVSFKGLPKRFCMHCGTRMDMDAASCPKCGLTPPSGVDTKACPTCSTVIPEAAKYCYNCGARQSETKP